MFDIYLPKPSELKIQSPMVYPCRSELERKIYEIGDLIARNARPSYEFIVDESFHYFSDNAYAIIWMHIKCANKTESLTPVALIDTKESVDNLFKKLDYVSSDGKQGILGSYKIIRTNG